MRLDGVRGRHHPAPAPRRPQPAEPCRGEGDRPSAARGPGGHPRGGLSSPGRQAGERHADPGGAGRADGLRHREGGGVGRHRRRHAGVLGAGAGGGGRRGPARGRLRDRHRPGGDGRPGWSTGFGNPPCALAWLAGGSPAGPRHPVVGRDPESGRQGTERALPLRAGARARPGGDRPPGDGDRRGTAVPRTLRLHRGGSGVLLRERGRSRGGVEEAAGEAPPGGCRSLRSRQEQFPACRIDPCQARRVGAPHLHAWRRPVRRPRAGARPGGLARHPRHAPDAAVRGRRRRGRPVPPLEK